MRKVLLGIFLLGFLGSQAQETDDDFDLEGHYLGLQVNELVRQIFSLGNTNLPSNPYFFNYTYTSPSGSGLNAGFAYTLDEISTNNQFNTITTTVNNFAFRIGYSKTKALTRRFVYSLGVDLTVDSQKNETKNADSFSSQEIITTTKRTGWGLGPRFTFQYRLSENISIGTEANYYFKSLNDEFTVRFSNSTGNDQEDDSKIKQFTFSPPAILWLTVRL